MTKQELIQELAHHNMNIEISTKAIRFAKDKFIKDNAPYPVGATVEVEAKGIQKVLKIRAYTVEKDLRLSPVFETLEGKNVFLSRPLIIKLIK